VTHPSKRVINSSSGEGGDKNPPPGKIEISHKLPLRKKRNNIIQEEEENRVESDINSFSLEDMELKPDIEKMFPNIDHPEARPTKISRWKLLRMRYLMKKNHLYFRALSLTMNLKN
jgi:hypothetical protein